MATKTKTKTDPMDIPEFLLVKNRQAPTPEEQARIDEAARAAGQRAEGEAENPERAALRAAYGHQLPRDVDWNWLRRLLAERAEAREERREERAAARADMVSVADVAAKLGEKVRDVRRALRRDPATLTPDARRVHKRIPRLAKRGRFDPADVADVCVAARAGLAVLRGAGGAVEERHVRIRGDGRVRFRAVVLDLRRERPEWRGLTRKRVLPALRDRWPQLEAEQALVPGDVEAAKAAVRAWLGRPGSASATPPAPAQLPAPAPASATASAASGGGAAAGKCAQTRAKGRGGGRRVRRQRSSG